jgi:outer membrane protein OmpA-like peptidoglycan-associated protein
MGSTEFTRSFFGFREPFDYRRPECFSSSDAIPDCRQLPPLTNIGKYRDAEPLSGDDEMDDGTMITGERQVFFPDVNFDFDKAGLNDLGRGRVRQIAQLLASVPSLSIVVEGHADYKGTDEYNNSLGERRAQAVIGELAELGIDPNRLSPISYGEGKPVFTEEEDWARAVNRRVQFSVQGEASEEAPAVEAEEAGDEE